LQDKIEGNVAGTILETNKLTDIRLTETNKYPVSLNEINNSQIALPNGRLKPISEFAMITLTPGVAEIERENLKPMIAITARLNSRDLGSTLKEIQQKLNSGLVLPVVI